MQLSPTGLQALRTPQYCFHVISIIYLMVMTPTQAQDSRRELRQSQPLRGVEGKASPAGVSWKRASQAAHLSALHHEVSLNLFPSYCLLLAQPLRLRWGSLRKCLRR